MLLPPLDGHESLSTSLLELCAESDPTRSLQETFNHQQCSEMVITASMAVVMVSNGPATTSVRMLLPTGQSNMHRVCLPKWALASQVYGKHYFA
jgi:hypothetical protein